MSLSGNIYGVVLNDRAELDRLAPQFFEKPHLAPPHAPVVYMKPQSALASGPVRSAGAELVCAPTVALLMARDAASVSAQDAMACVGAMALALDLSLPQPGYYRPAVAQKNGDDFLALGQWVAPALPSHIRTSMDGAVAHLWALDRLLRTPAALISALSDFMTLKAGDILLVGLPGDAPVVRGGWHLRVEADGLPALDVEIAA